MAFSWLTSRSISELASHPEATVSGEGSDKHTSEAAIRENHRAASETIITAASNEAADEDSRQDLRPRIAGSGFSERVSPSPVRIDFDDDEEDDFRQSASHQLTPHTGRMVHVPHVPTIAWDHQHGERTAGHKRPSSTVPELCPETLPSTSAEPAITIKDRGSPRARARGYEGRPPSVSQPPSLYQETRIQATENPTRHVHQNRMLTWRERALSSYLNRFEKEDTEEEELNLVVGPRESGRTSRPLDSRGDSLTNMPSHPSFGPSRNPRSAGEEPQGHNQATFGSDLSQSSKRQDERDQAETGDEIRATESQTTLTEPGRPLISALSTRPSQNAQRTGAEEEGYSHWPWTDSLEQGRQSSRACSPNTRASEREHVPRTYDAGSSTLAAGRQVDTASVPCVGPAHPRREKNIQAGSREDDDTSITLGDHSSSAPPHCVTAPESELAHAFQGPVLSSTSQLSPSRSSGRVGFAVLKPPDEEEVSHHHSSREDIEAGRRSSGVADTSQSSQRTTTGSERAQCPVDGPSSSCSLAASPASGLERWEGRRSSLGPKREGSHQLQSRSRSSSATAGDASATAANAIVAHPQGKSSRNRPPCEHILLVVHGIGCEAEGGVIHKQQFVKSLSLVNDYWFWRKPVEVHVHAINWKQTVIHAQEHMFEHITLKSLYETRRVLTLTAADLLFFLTPRYGDFVITQVAAQLNEAVAKLRAHPSERYKNSKISVLGYSLGSVMAYELLAERPFRPSAFSPATNPSPRLTFNVDFLFLLGSSLPAFLLLHSPEILKEGMWLPKDLRLYNIFHPCDPVAFRIEKLVYPHVKQLPPPVLLAFWRTNGVQKWYEWDMNVQFAARKLVTTVDRNSTTPSLCSIAHYYQHAKNVLMQNISDFASSISNSLFSWWHTEKGVQRPDGVSVLDANAAAAAAAALSSQRERAGLGRSSKLSKSRYRRPTSADQEDGGDGKGKQNAARGLESGGADGATNSAILRQLRQPGGSEQMRGAVVPSDRTALRPADVCAFRHRLRQTRPRRRAEHHRRGISESTDDDEDEEDEPGALCGSTPTTALGRGHLDAANRTGSIDGHVQSSGYLSSSSKSASSSGQLRALAAAAAAEVTLEAVEELKERSGDGEPLHESDVRATVVGAAAGAVPLLATDGGAGQEEPEEDIWDLLYRPARPRDEDGEALSDATTSSTGSGAFALEQVEQQEQETSRAMAQLEAINEQKGPEFLQVRVDFQLQEDTTEHYLSSLAMLQSHFNYWKLKDVAFFILKCLTGTNPTLSYTDHLKQLESAARKAAEKADRESNEQERRKQLQLAAALHQRLDSFRGTSSRSEENPDRRTRPQDAQRQQATHSTRRGVSAMGRDCTWRDSDSQHSSGSSGSTRRRADGDRGSLERRTKEALDFDSSEKRRSSGQGGRDGQRGRTERLAGRRTLTMDFR
ncbi:ddhd domain-containing protein [Cystoisospora suis]|uniref:Ddhd domain-containing protein n=1 Tax=Cystoisospora suis TaxID=483139 RepID=A0A2C6L1W3_9APIC|nr:ddhd domain-containing protein [Cystoisospora suis]